MPREHMHPTPSRNGGSVASRLIRCGRYRVRIERRPLIMGILNVTPDSFSDGGRFVSPRAALEHGLAMVEDGADLLDVGGESTRPGSRPVPLGEELRRTIPVIERLAKRVRLPIAVDTTKAEVARRALEAGASIVNDTSALRDDPEMLELLAAREAAVILMHRAGTPRTMQRHAAYGDVVEEIAAFLSRRAMTACRAGVDASRIVLDPGIGFGKTLAHNLALLRGLHQLLALGYPILLGPSRKSFLGTLLGAPVEDRLAGTLACLAAAMRQGVHIVRVHDVRPAAQLLRTLEAIEAA